MSRVISRRRTSVAAAVGLSAALALAACGGTDSESGSIASDDSGEVIELVYWAWGPTNQTMVDLWNEQNPDVQVTLEKIPAGNKGGYAKMHAAVQAGNAPDLGTVEYQMIPSFVVNDELVNLAEYGAGDLKDQFVEWQWDQGVFGDAVYAMPTASGPIAMYYRTDIFDQLGIEVPTTWVEYEAAARAIKAHDPTMYIAAFPPGNAAWFGSLAWQAGAKWFGTEGDDWVIDIDDEATLKVAEFWNRMVDDDLVKVQPDFSEEWYKDLQDGKILTWPSAMWGAVTLEQQAGSTAGNWGIAPIPQWNHDGEFVSANYGGASTAVFRGSEHPHEAMKVAAFIGGSAEGAEVQAQHYNWPPVNNLENNQALKEPRPFFGGQSLYDVFSQSDQSIDKSWQWIPTIEATYQSLADGFQRAVNGPESLTDAVKTAHEETVAEMKTQGFTVAQR